MPRAHNWVAAVAPLGPTGAASGDPDAPAGVAWLDVSTGTLKTSTTTVGSLLLELARYACLGAEGWPGRVRSVAEAAAVLHSCCTHAGQGRRVLFCQGSWASSARAQRVPAGIGGGPRQPPFFPPPLTK